MSGILTSPFFTSGGKRWEYITMYGPSTSSPAQTPAPVEKGDLLVLLFAHGSGSRGSLPAGWSWLHTDASPRHCYKIVTAWSNEIENIWPNSVASGCRAIVAQFRAKGGDPFLHAQQTNVTDTTVTLTAPASPSLLIAAGNTAAAGSWTTTTHPAFDPFWTEGWEADGAPMLYAGASKLNALASTGAMKIKSSVAYRQSYAIFGIN